MHRGAAMHRALPLAAIAAVFATPSPARAQVAVSDPSFVVEVLNTGAGTISIEFDASGRMYVAEKQGRLLLFAPNGSGGFSAPIVVADLRATVAADQESGLLGMALDPSFASNRFIYLFYTTAADQRLTRITVDASYAAMVPGSELILVSGFPRTVTYHKAGDIHFHPNDPDNIYIALGDDNDRSGAQDLTRYAGKMLRVNRTNGQGIVTNPFQDGNMNSVRSRIWAIGFRNPFRFTFRASSDAMYVSENGNSTDRISIVRMGSNGAWSTAGDNGGFLNPPDPNHHVMTTDVPSTVGIAIAESGAFTDPANPNSPTIYAGNYVQRRIRRWRLTGSGFDTLTPIAQDNGAAFATNINPIDLQFGPDGALYVSSTNGGEATSGYQLLRIRRTNGAPPIASFTTSPSPARGPPPLSVAFTDTSHDPDGTIAARSWSFGDNTTSTAQNPTHTYANAGTYTVALTVTDNSLQQATAQTTVTVSAGTTLTLSGRIVDGTNLNDQNITFATELRLYRLDGVTPLSNTSAIPVSNGNISATVSIELNEPGLVISAGETGGLIAAYRAVTVPLNATSASASLTYYLSSTAVRGRITDTRGAGAITDVTVARGSPGTPYSVAGGTITSDDFGWYYVAIRPGTAGTSFYFNVASNVGRATYVPNSFNTTVANNALVVRDVTVGLQNGGLVCDDLSAIADTPNVDYATRLQPILDARCTGCHNSSSGQNGGLILDGDSWPRLVNAISTSVPGKLLVEPSSSVHSFLFEKINCNDPQRGTRMRPADPIPAQEQALFRSWIAQGAPRQASSAQPAQTPWQSNANGTLMTNVAQNSAGGYHFTPLRAGRITAIGGYFNGTKIVRLFDRTSGALLAEATVTSANGWAYAAINPVHVNANSGYTIAVYLAGSGGSARTNTAVFPRAYGDIRIDAGTAVGTAQNASARPTQSMSNNVPGQPDLQFVPD